MAASTKITAMQHAAEKQIFVIRGQRVMLDSDLASYYGVETEMVNRQAQRNSARFPVDFRFQLTEKEVAIAVDLLRQNGGANVVSSKRRWLPWVYTMKGVIAVAGVIKSPRADVVAVAIPRAFEAMALELRQLPELAQRLENLELTTVTQRDFNKLKQEIAGAFRELNAAKGIVTKALPPGVGS
jgi:hypothetical protein